MVWATDAIRISDGSISIQNYRTDERGIIADAIHDPEGWMGSNMGLDTPEKVCLWLERSLERQGKNFGNPFVYRVNGEIAGVSRFLRVDPDNKSLEIGGTWIARKWKRTFVNTTVKHLLLKHAFETLAAARVEFRVNSRNFTSQMSMLRLGAVFEASLRNATTYVGQEPNDVFLYSILKSEWPRIESRLLCLRSRKPPVPLYFPAVFDTPRLRLEPYRLEDAAVMLQLVRRNRESLVSSFPQSAKFQSEHEVRAFIAEKSHLASSGAAFFYGVWDRTSQTLIGQLQIKNVDWKARSAELGYYVDKVRRKEGLASEFLELAVNELRRQEFRRLVIRVVPDNMPSLRLAKKFGFEAEGVQRSVFLTGTGALSDLVVLSKMLK